jgi:DNA-binding transcriptional MocR family regulator
MTLPPGVARKGRGVISVHSFSKTLGTGLRLGYVHGSPEMLGPCE